MWKTGQYLGLVSSPPRLHDFSSSLSLSLGSTGCCNGLFLPSSVVVQEVEENYRSLKPTHLSGSGMGARNGERQLNTVIYERICNCTRDARAVTPPVSTTCSRIALGRIFTASSDSTTTEGSNFDDDLIFHVGIASTRKDFTQVEFCLHALGFQEPFYHGQQTTMSGLTPCSGAGNRDGKLPSPQSR